MSGEVQWDLRWWRYWSDDEDSFEKNYDEYQEDPDQKELRILKSKHEKARNANNLAHQEALNAPASTHKEQMRALEKKIEATKIKAIKAEDELVKFAKSKNMEPFSENEMLLMEMRRETSAIDGAWNLHRSSLKNTRGMSKEQIVKVCDMKEKGAENLNFQFSIGPDGSGSVSGGSELWYFGFEVKRLENHNVQRRGKYKRQRISTVLNTDVLKFDFVYQDHPTWAPGPGFEVFIINSDNEIIETAKMYECRDNYLSIDHDRLKMAGQKISDVTYRAVVNVFELNEDGEEDSDENSDENSDKDSDENLDEDSDY